MNTRQAIKQEIDILASLPHTSSDIRNELLRRIQDPRPLTRDEGESDHFCAMFVPTIPSTARVFIGHHIKSGLWIPPGGHIDRGETPIQAAVRECQEELGISINSTDLKLFDRSYAPITNRPQCSRHLDLWYVLSQKTEASFQYDTNEFHEAGWYHIEQAIKLCSRRAYQHVFIHLSQQIDSLPNAL